MYAENNGVKICYEVHGQGEPTLVMVPGFQIAYSEVFKRTYVPFLSRHMRVVTLDLRGNGASDRPEGGYDLETYVEDVNAVVEAAQLDRFAMAGLSLGVPILIKYHATHPGKATHLILLSGYATLIRSEKYHQGAPKELLEGALLSWQNQPEAMLKGFIGLGCSEQYSLRTKDLIWQWAQETSPRIWGICAETAFFSGVDEYLEGTNLPVLIIHGKKDRIVFPVAAEYLHQRISSSNLMLIPNAGHGFLRSWPQVGRHILDFLKPESRKDMPPKKLDKTRKALWISSPIGMGHAKRDLVIAREMRERMPDLVIHWLCTGPARSFLEAAGEAIHPLSDALWDECGHFESHAKAYSLYATEAYWVMDKLLNNNFMVFTDAVREDAYDLVLGDESWEVAEHLHYNPSLKTAPFVFMTDFVGASNVSEDETRQAHVFNVNGVWVEMREVHPEASDLSIFVGEPEDIPNTPLGEGLPSRKEWAEKYFRFSGYVLPFDPADYADRQTLRTGLGFASEDRIIVVAVGGTSLGLPLIEKYLKAQNLLRAQIPGIRSIILCGPRIDPQSFEASESVEFWSFTPDPTKLYAACDLAVIQGGLSTAMELTALGRPFLYFPLKDHFEQQEYVGFRLERYRAGVRMDFDHTSPSQLAEVIIAKIGVSVDYKPVNKDGAKRAASMILELLQRGRAS